jgi:hypothetical protein
MELLKLTIIQNEYDLIERAKNIIFKTEQLVLKLKKFSNLIKMIIEKHPILSIYFEKEIQADWRKVRKKYEPLITMSDRTKDLDILLINIPVFNYFNNYNIESIDTISDNIVIRHNTVSGWLAKLASEINKRWWYSVWICYWNNIYWRINDSYTRFRPIDFSLMALSMNIDVLWISILSIRELPYAKILIEQTKKIAKYTNKKCPEFIIGGPQATLDRDQTANTLGIKINNVIKWRWVKEALIFIDNLKW